VVESGGDGTTFTATIPALVAADSIPGSVAADDAQDITSLVPIVTAEQTTAMPELENGTHGEDVATLLVVDDSADLRSYIRDHFASRFRVLEAADGAEGIALARRHLPDVVLSDVMMPGTDGHELVRALRSSAETDFLAIILLTAQADDADRLAGLERGVDDYIVKPFEMRELDVRVRNLILSRRRLRERFSVGSVAVGAGQLVETRTAPVDLTPADEAYVARLRDAIQRGLSDPDFGVGELADAMSQDRSRVFRRVKQLFGESPSDLIRRMRLEEGRRLLTETPASVADIAYASGFNSLSYFCACFHEVYGVTPAAFRKDANGVTAQGRRARNSERRRAEGR